MMADKSRETQELFQMQGLLVGDDVNKSMAEQFGMEIIEDLSCFRLPKEYYKKVSYSFAKKNLTLPIIEDQGTITVAVADPLNLEPLEELRLILDVKIKAIYSPKDCIMNAINEVYNQEHGAASQLIADLSDKNDDESNDGEILVYDLLDDSGYQAPIIKLLNLILTEAIQQGASDIHFEPLETGLRVRYRIDGILQNRHTPSPEFQTQLLTRIKVMAKLDIAEHRLPQDGRIKLRMGRREIDFRVSTVPISNGERIVLRILDRSNVILGLDRIGMIPEVFDEFKKLITLPEGVILVTGPTGSGKTTTLYSAISGLNNDETNVMTIEDPVEYHLKGIAQIAVHKKISLDFAAGLRHILRQDPDVIMIGEIRDSETAEIAIQASLTGHLVLSTLHTNDAPSAITRLVDMGVQPYLLSSSVCGVLAQRLVRRICPDCKIQYEPLDRELAALGLKREALKNGKISKGAGCSSCFNTGYKGRQGIYELMIVNNEIKKQIVKSPDAVELRRIALETGMISILTHGAELVKQDLTTVSEVLRVTRGLD